MAQNIYSTKSQEQKDFYNKTAQKYNKWHVEQASAKIVDAWNFANLEKFIKKNKNGELSRCLNLGCGTGRLSHNLFKISGEVYGLDQSNEVLKIAKEKYPKLKLTCAEVVNTPYEDNYFDMVIINGSLHHFFAVEETFAEVNRILKPKGFFILLGEPNAGYLKAYNPFFYGWVVNRIFSKILNLFKVEKDKKPEMIEPDAEVYVPAKLKKQLIKHGFKIKQLYTYDYFHRTENKLALSFYHNYLNFEHSFIAKIFPNMGSAIQCFAIKK